MLPWLGAIGGIVFVDLVLSGDNALVIGAAAAKLPRRQRLIAIATGGAGAIILRILFTILATVLLNLPFLGIVGSAILLLIAFRLLLERYHERHAASAQPTKHPEGHEKHKEHVSEPVKKRSILRQLFSSVATILIADVTMSLDNVLAVGGLAQGDLFFVMTGLFLSITLLLIGSAVVAELIGRLPWLLDVACLVLAWTASNLFVGDDSLIPFFTSYPWVTTLVPIVMVALIIVCDAYLWRDRWRRPS